MTRSLRLRAGLLAGATALLLAGLVGCTDDTTGDDNGSGGDDEASSTYEATIRRTTDGVPHVTGATFADAAFGQGYASGQDRTCDLADQIVKIRGERARWFGAGEDDANLNADIQWRTIGIFERAQDDWQELDPEVRSMFEAFAAGWNAQLDEVGVDDVAGWCAGEEWVRPVEPSEVYAYARAIALNASGTRIGTFIATAQPPEAPAAGDGSDDGSDEGAAGSLEGPIASNGWAIGAERSTSGGGMLVANPHFPWEGELRFWEVQLTVPGATDIYGVQLSGVPGIGIGFNEDFGWTHTVSAGNRFTAYTLDLVPGSPTTYRYGDEERDMTSETFTIEVLGDDGELDEVDHTSWYSHYGPIIDFPGYGWTDESAITYRDANIDNDEFVEQYYAMAQATTFDELVEAHERWNGVPLFNTIATSADGRAWYADTSATPNLSDEALAGYEDALKADPVVKLAADNGAVLLDGSDPTYEWVEVDGARDPGLVPYAEQPQITRDDYAFNANDSFWVPHATERIEGDYSPLHGRQQTPRSPRTRENATILADASATGASGDDGTFTLDELAEAALANTGYTSRALLDEVVGRCSEAGTVTVPALEPEDPELGGLPAGEVDVTDACAVLAGWDGVYDLDRAGPPLWRELMSRYEFTDFTTGTSLWAEPFDPDDAIATPSGLAPAPAGGDDPVVVNLARAVQALDLAGFEPDVTLGDAQFALRNGTTVPIHGGGYVDGTTNVVGFGRGWSILDPTLAALQRDVLVEGSALADIDDGIAEPTQGYLVNNGTSFLMALAYGPDGPEAKVLLTYGNTEDRDADTYPAVTERFSGKDWRTVAFTDEAIEADATDTITVRG